MNARIRRLLAAIRRGNRHIAQIRHNNRARRQIIKRLRREHQATVMFDSIEVAQIPASAPAVAGYVGGKWPTYLELQTHFPKAQKLSIAVSAAEDAQCLDIEAGDATPGEAPAWVRRQFDRGVKRPVLYTSASQMDLVVSVLRAAGISRSQVRLWSAHYTFTPHLCGPHSCGLLHSTTADATQWTDNALGRNLDQSLVVAGFFA